MSVYGLWRTVVLHLLHAKIVDRHHWGPTTSYCLWPSLSPGYSFLFINYDHWSLIKSPVCMALVLSTCGKSKSSVFGRGTRAVRTSSWGVMPSRRTGSLRATSNRTISRKTTSTRTTSWPGNVEQHLGEVLLGWSSKSNNGLGEQLLVEQLVWRENSFSQTIRTTTSGTGSRKTACAESEQLLTNGSHELRWRT